MIPFVAPHRRTCLLYVGLSHLFGLVSIAGAGGLPVTAPALSQLEVTARVPFAQVEGRIREFVDARVDKSPEPFEQTVELWRVGEVGATVTHRPKVAGLRLKVEDSGRLTVSLPIAVDVRSRRSGVAGSLVDVSGCGAGTLYLMAAYRPLPGSAGLEYAQQRLWVSGGGYTCVIGAKQGIRDAARRLRLDVTLQVDVAAQIRGEIKARARKALAGTDTNLAGWIHDRERIHKVAANPVVFGDALALGVDLQRFTPQSLTVDGTHFKMLGIIEGRPRLHFGTAWPAPGPLPAQLESVQAFHLPVVALFPRDDALLPDQAPSTAGFGLQPVPNRPDLAVLQRRQGDAVENVIWLSGSGYRPPGDPIRFDRPIRDVLDEILAWLDRPQSLQGMAGADRLVAKVRSFKGLIEQFQQPTRIPLEGRGELVFRDISVDLLGVWVTAEAIWADVVLRGTAAIELDWTL